MDGMVILRLESKISWHKSNKYGYPKMGRTTPSTNHLWSSRIYFRWNTKGTHCSLTQQASFDWSRARVLIWPKKGEHFEVRPDASEYKKLLTKAELVIVQKRNIPRTKIVATASRPLTQTGTEEKGIFVQQATVDGLLRKLYPLSFVRQYLTTPIMQCRTDVPVLQGCLTPCVGHNTDPKWLIISTDWRRLAWAVDGIGRSKNKNAILSSSTTRAPEIDLYKYVVSFTEEVDRKQKRFFR